MGWALDTPDSALVRIAAPQGGRNRYERFPYWCDTWSENVSDAQSQSPELPLGWPQSMRAGKMWTENVDDLLLRAEDLRRRRRRRLLHWRKHNPEHPLIPNCRVPAHGLVAAIAQPIQARRDSLNTR